MNATELETDRLRLRLWREADLASFARLNADVDVMRFLPRRLSREESDGLAGRIRDHFDRTGWGLWAVEVKDKEPFIGFLGLAEPRFSAFFTPCVEVGWRLDKSFWGQGYASEGARAAIAYAFEELGLAELVSFTTESNLRSRAVMERIGMIRDPVEDFDHPTIEDGHPLRRHVLYRLKNPGHAFRPSPMISTFD